MSCRGPVPYGPNHRNSITLFQNSPEVGTCGAQFFRGELMGVQRMRAGRRLAHSLRHSRDVLTVLTLTKRLTQTTGKTCRLPFISPGFHVCPREDSTASDATSEEQTECQPPNRAIC